MVLNRGIDFDKLGAFASTACAIHCLLTGVAMGVLSVAGIGFLGSIWTDVAFVSVALLAGSFAIRQGLKKHGLRWPMSIFFFGLTSVLVGHIVFHEGAWPSTILSVLGGLSIVGFHVVNIRLGHTCSVSTPE